MIEQIAKEIFATAVEQAPHAEWEHLFWEDMTEEEKTPFLEAASRVVEIWEEQIREDCEPAEQIEAPVSIKCEKCQDRGFTEQEHGLIMVLCDCDKGREVAEREGIPIDSFEGMVNVHEGEVDGNSSFRTEQDNQPAGSTDTSKSKRTRKSKAKKKARTRAG